MCIEKSVSENARNVVLGVKYKIIKVIELIEHNLHISYTPTIKMAL